ncbi:hypothetical protein BsWGS_25667 [Bradybaena similaris]
MIGSTGETRLRTDIVRNYDRGIMMVCLKRVITLEVIAFYMNLLLPVCPTLYWTPSTCMPHSILDTYLCAPLYTGLLPAPLYTGLLPAPLCTGLLPMCPTLYWTLSAYVSHSILDFYLCVPHCTGFLLPVCPTLYWTPTYVPHFILDFYLPHSILDFYLPHSVLDF